MTATTTTTTTPTQADRQLLDEALAGLASTPRTLPCKLLYDQRGSELFDQICRLPEYYPTRTEHAIMRDHIGEITDRLGPDVTLIELGSGSSPKTPLLLDHLQRLAGYVPIDISRDQLLDTAKRLRERYPAIDIRPVHADYTRPLNLPRDPARSRRRVIYFPGSTLGNFHPADARVFLNRLANLAGPGGAVLLGADLRKDPAVLVPAYNDAAGVTAAFNRNILVRLRDEWGAQLEPDGFEHDARWNEIDSRIEMHLVANDRQEVRLAGRSFVIEPGESIWTESSYKHGITGWSALSDLLQAQQVWTDPSHLFSVQYLTVTR